MKRLYAKSKQGFTLIEMIAVLMILGILGVVAITRYIDFTEQARIQAARTAIAEISSRLSAAQGKYMINNGGVAPTSPVLFSYAAGANVYGSAENLANAGDDFVAVVATGTPITITVSSVGNVTLSPPVSGSFTAAGD
jgi:prepilin-type N-terminal cleavage/methylation domain-containing protein